MKDDFDAWLEEPPKDALTRLKEKGGVPYRLFKKRKRKFLNALAQSGNVSGSLKAAGWNRDNMLYWKKNDPLFAHQYDLAIDKAADMLEAEATRRAVNGYEDVQLYQGKVVYHQYPVGHPRQGEFMLDEWGDPIPVVVRKYSDRLLELLLKAARPDKFRENIEVNNTHRGGVLVVGMMGQPTDPKKFASYEEEVAAHQEQFRITGTERQKLEDKGAVEIIPPDPNKPKARVTTGTVTR